MLSSLFGLCIVPLMVLNSLECPRMGSTIVQKDPEWPIVPDHASMLGSFALSSLFCRLRSSGLRYKGQIELVPCVYTPDILRSTQ